MLNHRRITSIGAIAFLVVAALNVSIVSAEVLDKKVVSAEAYKAYQLGNYERALELYSKIGEQMPAPKPELEFNKGAANYRLGSFEDALEDFDLAKTSEIKSVAENAHYNMGNTHFQSQKFDKAIEEYKEALKLDPTDTDAKYNLELALRELQKQEQEQKQDDQQDKDKDKDKEENKEKQDKKDEQDKDKQDKDKQDQDKQDKKDDQQKQDDKQKQDQQPDSTQSKDQQDQQQQVQPQQMSKEDAERLLNSLKDEEMKQQKRKVLLSSYPYTGKKW